MSGTRRKSVEKINSTMVESVKDKHSRASGNSVTFVLYLGILWQKLVCIL